MIYIYRAGHLIFTAFQTFKPSDLILRLFGSMRLFVQKEPTQEVSLLQQKHLHNCRLRGEKKKHNIIHSTGCYVIIIILILQPTSSSALKTR